MEREKIKLSEEELENFEFATTGYKGDRWKLRGEIYDYFETVRTDQYSDGPSWDIIVQRQSDSKFFKWNCWNAGDVNGYIMSDGDEYQIQQVFPKTILKITYE